VKRSKLDWLGNIFNNSKDFEDKISLIQKKLDKSNNRILALQEQLLDKEQDINKADKTIQKIIQIWRNINSSESLPKILTSIINALCKDLDFLYCFLFQVYNVNGKPVLKVSHASQVSYFNLDEILDNRLKTFIISCKNDNNCIVKTIKSQKIQQIDIFQEIFEGSDITLEKNKIDKLESIFIDRAITAIPLMVQDAPYGCLVAISVHQELTSLDKNYLQLFAGQIELSVSMTRLLDTVKKQAVTDVLTGLYNRRYFNESLERETQRAERSRIPFTLITLDLDHLKHINDTYGHGAGDEAIAAIGKVLRKSARETDISARFGGEEFAVIMPNTDLEGGLIAAERIRAMIESFPMEQSGNISASIGVATYFKHADNLDDLIKLADQAMYTAKNNGRNRVEIAKTIICPGDRIEH